MMTFYVRGWSRTRSRLWKQIILSEINKKKQIFYDYMEEWPYDFQRRLIFLKRAGTF
jgi:hypothetical protein